jgi:hypothetical protein
LQRFLNHRLAALMIHATQRLSSRKDTLFGGFHRRAQQTFKEGARQVGQIDSHYQVPFGQPGGKTGVDPRERSAPCENVFHNRVPQAVVALRGTRDRDSSASRCGDNREHPFKLRDAVRTPPQECFVRSHASASAPRENESVYSLDRHEKMVAVEFLYWIAMTSELYSKRRNNRWRNCSLLVCTLMLSVYAQIETPKRTVSTVKADYRTGKLVRTTVVVESKVVTPRTVAPVEVASPVKNDSAPIAEIVESAASRHGVDPALVHSVIKAESNYNPSAVSRVGARGLMQLMPATARQLGVNNAFNPKDNIEGGVKYLRYLQDKFQDPVLALAAYNAGEGTVARYSNSVPPYRETQDYVVKVAKNYRAAKAAGAAEVRKSSGAITHQNPEPAESSQPAPPKPPEYRKVHASYDSEGRLYLRTQ